MGTRCCTDPADATITHSSCVDLRPVKNIANVVEGEAVGEYLSDRKVIVSALQSIRSGKVVQLQ